MLGRLGRSHALVACGNVDFPLGGLCWRIHTGEGAGRSLVRRETRRAPPPSPAHSPSSSAATRGSGNAPVAAPASTCSYPRQPAASHDRTRPGVGRDDRYYKGRYIRPHRVNDVRGLCCVWSAADMLTPCRQPTIRSCGPKALPASDQVPMPAEQGCRLDDQAVPGRTRQ